MELQVFNSTEFGSVRTATVNGEAMFVGKDVADILGYQNGSRDINRHVNWFGINMELGKPIYLPQRVSRPQGMPNGM